MGSPFILTRKYVDSPFIVARKYVNSPFIVTGKYVKITGKYVRFPYFWVDSGFQSTVVYRALSIVHEGLLEITLTLPWMNIEYACI